MIISLNVLGWQIDIAVSAAAAVVAVDIRATVVMSSLLLLLLLFVVTIWSIVDDDGQSGLFGSAERMDQQRSAIL